MHRRKDLWGPDGTYPHPPTSLSKLTSTISLLALEFDPDRFLDYRLHKYLTPNPFIFLPFNAGPRICLGQQFAYNETSFFLVRLLQRFDEICVEVGAFKESARVPEEWRKSENVRKRREKVRAKTHLTMYVSEGLWVTMREARGDH
jgi:hypothetical protein